MGGILLASTAVAAKLTVSKLKNLDYKTHLVAEWFVVVTVVCAFFIGRMTKFNNRPKVIAKSMIIIMELQMILK